MISDTRFDATKQFITAEVRGIHKCIMCPVYIVPKYECSYYNPINLPYGQFSIHKVVTVFRIKAASDG